MFVIEAPSFNFYHQKEKKKFQSVVLSFPFFSPLFLVPAGFLRLFLPELTFFLLPLLWFPVSFLLLPLRGGISPSSSSPRSQDKQGKSLDHFISCGHRRLRPQYGGCGRLRGS